MITYCTDCEMPFVRAERSRALRCLPCWKNRQGYNHTKADDALILMSEALDELLCRLNGSEDTTSLNNKIKTLEAQEKILRAEIETLKVNLSIEMGNRFRPPSQSIPKDKIKILLTLCHPDKHGGSNEKATEITKWLLSQR